MSNVTSFVAHWIHPHLMFTAMKTTRFFAPLLPLFFISSLHAASVQQFQPQGKVADQTRVTVRFSSPVIKLGDANAAAPFNIECNNIAGEGRWIDERSWAWQMSRPLQAGERCVFALKAGYTVANGESFTGKSRFEFFGAAPRPWAIRPAPGSGIGPVTG